MDAKEKKAGLDAAALAQAQMERGTYAFPDEKQRFNGDGTYRVVIAELCRVAGFKPGYLRAYDYFKLETSQDETHEKYKHAQYFQGRLSYYRLKLDGGFKKALMATDEKTGLSLTSIVSCLEGSILDDLLDEEKSIPFREKAALYAQLKPLAAKLDSDGKVRDKDGGNTIHADVMNVIMNQIQDPGAQSRLSANLEHEHAQGKATADDVIEVMVEDDG